MVSINKTQMDLLVALQGIETESQGIKAKLRSASEKIQLLDGELEDFTKTIEAKEATLGALRKQYRAYESDIEGNVSRVKKSQAKLREVKTNKEYQSILKEIDDMKAITSRIEDQMIDCLDQMEAAERFLTEKKLEYARLKQQVGEDKTAIGEESEAGQNRIDVLDAEWNRLCDQVEPDLMKTYLTIRSKRGTAIAAVVNAVCHGCHLNIPPQMFNELQRFDSLRFCPYCQRIIYWKNSGGESDISNHAA